MKLKDYQQGREDGLAFALRIVEKGGVSALKEEIKARNITGIKINARIHDLETTGAAQQVKDMVMNTVLAMALEVLMDEFDFGKSRLLRFAGRFNFKTNCMAERFVDWVDFTKDIEKRTGIRIDVSLEDGTSSIYGIPDGERKETKRKAKMDKHQKEQKKAEKNKEPKKAATKKEKVKK